MNKSVYCKIISFVLLVISILLILASGFVFSASIIGFNTGHLSYAGVGLGLGIMVGWAALSFLDEGHE
jgi:hypothetical protein